MVSVQSPREKRDRRITLLAIFVGVFVAQGISRNWGGWGGFFAGMLLCAVCGAAAALISGAVLSRHRKRDSKEL